MVLRIISSCALAVACFAQAVAAQESALDVHAFFPAAATLKQRLNLTGDDGSATVLVYSSPDESRSARATPTVFES
jgi:hypothetical protein